ncbi:MAG: nitroreductase family protein [Chloroflexota bacterium]
MLTVKEAIQKRRSVRRFKDQPVADELIREILEAARLAPSAMNLQPWRFIVVKDQEKRSKLAEICWHQKSIAEAPVAIACFGDRGAYSRESRTRRREEVIERGATSQGTNRFADPKFREYVKSHPLPLAQDTIVSIVSNTFIAIENMLLMATGLGLATCWVGGFTESDKLSQLLGAPEEWFPIAVIPVGYAEGDIGPDRPRRALTNIVRWV